MNREEVSSYLSEHNILPEKKFGQNFLCDDSITKKIIEISSVSSGDTVLEIGPGIGALTREFICINSDITCIEIDKRLSSYLSNEFPSLKLISSDFLKLSSEDYKASSYKYVVSNIPYYLTTEIITKIILECTSASRLTFMIEEAALQRIRSIFGNKNYGPLAIICSLFGFINKELTVAGDAFIPRPNTVSCIITLTRNKECSRFITKDFYQFLVRSFSQRRKKLINNLSSFYDKESLLESFTACGLSVDARAEEVSPLDFVNLYHRII